MVPRTGFEPVNDCLEGNCRSPLGDRGIRWSMGSLLLGVIANFFFHQVNVAAQNTGHPDALDHGGAEYWGRTSDL